MQFHLAGHANYTQYIIDTHDNHVIDPVWELYRTAHQLTGGVSTLLEWDANIPPLRGGARGGAEGEAFMGEHLPTRQQLPEAAGAAAEAALAAAHPSVFHPLHTIRPEVE